MPLVEREALETGNNKPLTLDNLILMEKKTKKINRFDKSHY